MPLLSRNRTSSGKLSKEEIKFRQLAKAIYCSNNSGRRTFYSRYHANELETPTSKTAMAQNPKVKGTTAFSAFTTRNTYNGRRNFFRFNFLIRRRNRQT